MPCSSSWPLLVVHVHVVDINLKCYRVGPKFSRFLGCRLLEFLFVSSQKDELDVVHWSEVNVCQIVYTNCTLHVCLCLYDYLSHHSMST